MSTVDLAEQFPTGQWEFTPAVVEEFDQHVAASVPHYDQLQAMIATTADWLVPADGVVADLGSSTARTAWEIQQRHPDRRVTFHLYDESPAMLEKGRRRLAGTGACTRTHTHEQRVEHDLQHADADLTLALFTLQFMRLEDRLRALRGARASAADGGALIVAEKIRPLGTRHAEIAMDASHDEKSLAGISDEGIRAKARALRGVLVPYSEPTLIDLLTAAGWSEAETFFRWHNWVAVLAFARPL